MATKKCINGHLYDPTIYGDNCPFCPSSNGATKVNSEYQEESGTRVLRHIEMDRTVLFAGFDGMRDGRIGFINKSESNYYKIRRIISPYSPGPDYDTYDESRIGHHGDGRKFKILRSYVNDIGGGPDGSISYIIKDIYDYSIEKQIGEGSHGSVWKAYFINDSGKKETVCIKMAKPGFEEALKKEYETLKVWNHPCIISPIDLYDDNGKICMVMPYYEKTAFSIKGKCDMLLAWRFCESLASALEYIHSKGLVHKDVKLSNILVGPEDRFILSDFSCMTKDISTTEDDWMFGQSILELVTGESVPSWIGNLEDIDFNYYGIKDSEMKSLIKFCLKKTPESHIKIDPFETRDIQAEYDIWTQVNDFRIVQNGKKYGLLNRFDTLVIPIEYDNLSSVNYYPDNSDLETGLKLRCLFKKGDISGSFLIDRDFAIMEKEYQNQDY